MAIKGGYGSPQEWSTTSWTIRASILLNRPNWFPPSTVPLSVLLPCWGQSKNIYQSEIDAVCETIDFLKYNVSFAGRIYELQPKSTYNQLNRLEYRSLEGFILAVSPFNFTSIAANLNMAPVMMGNTTVWKPASTAILSNYYLMKVFERAGLPAGVINFLPGQGSLIGNTCLSSKDLGGIHFTGSNGTFNGLWTQVGQNLSQYKSYPRLVGETGGKDFIFVHPSANIQDVVINTIRGALNTRDKNAAPHRVCMCRVRCGQKLKKASPLWQKTSKWEILQTPKISWMPSLTKKRLITSLLI